MLIELLQQVGLNKYEAEAYQALVRHGPLTGYELGKRSGVPLSRSYEILERLTARGLALVQPGDPPRYAAEAPDQFVSRTRAATLTTLDTLAHALAEAAQTPVPAGFWVVRGREPILAHARTLIGTARRTLALRLAPDHAAVLEAELAQARARGCRVVLSSPDAERDDSASVLVLVDNREGLAGTLAPAGDCQAVASTNPGFIAALNGFFTPRTTFTPLRVASPAPKAPEAPRLDWLDWEQHKQRSLLRGTRE